MSEQYPDLDLEREENNNYLWDAMLGRFTDKYPRRIIELSLSVGLLEISLGQLGEKSDLCICEASLFDEKEIDEFLAEFKSHLLDLIKLHKISNEKRRKPRKPRFYEGEYSKKYNEEKIANFMKFIFIKRYPIEQLLAEADSFYNQINHMVDYANEEIRDSEKE